MREDENKVVKVDLEEIVDEDTVIVNETVRDCDHELTTVTSKQSAC